PIPKQVHEEERKIRVRDGTEIKIRIYRPMTEGGDKDSTAGHPLIVMFHEGGFSMGDLTDEEVNCRVFSRDLRAVCVNMDYREDRVELAPEVQFPTWSNDSWDALQWAAQNARSFGADPSLGFVIGGASAGGNITAVLAHLARDGGLSPPLTGQRISQPPRCNPNQDPILTTRSSAETRARYQALLQTDLNDSPLQVPFHYGALESGHHGVPPVYLQVCGLDPLRHEGLIYERMLRGEAGVATRVDVYAGYGHGFWSNWPELPRSREFVEDTVKGVAWLLEQSKP
ncbi:Alpha/Beta hydrolase protein, partial [Microdochium bolleyi]